jgi:hypothetical protein
MAIPAHDGQVARFDGARTGSVVPRLYYVNGIRTDGREHARVAMFLSLLTEHVVFGVYNATAGKRAGSVLDVLQCAADWVSVFRAKVDEVKNVVVSGLLTDLRNFVRGSHASVTLDPVNVAESIRKRIPQRHRLAIVQASLSTYNQATASLFRQLYVHLPTKQIVVAHSQGNLITADALWSLQIVRGESALSQIRVYSLASPTPAWPLALRRNRGGGGRFVYGHLNDPVTFFDPHNWPVLANTPFGRNLGDWRTCTPEGGLLDCHDVHQNIALNFHNRIRSELHLPPIQVCQLLALEQQAAALVP